VVVGVIANLGLYFAVHTLFGTVTGGPLSLLVPDPATLRAVPLAIAVLAGLMLIRLRWSVPAVLSVSAALGLVAALADITGL